MPNSKSPRRKSADAQSRKQSRDDKQNPQQGAAQPLEGEQELHARDLRYPDWGDTTGMTGQP